MARQALSVKDWQDRLKANFTHDGIVGGKLMPLLREESDAGGKFTAKYFGQSRLSDSSQSFALETLQAVTSDKMTAGAKTNPYFQAIFVDFIMLFRRFRAASTLAMNGYMGPGFTILRDISDKAIHLSALFQSQVTYDDLLGVRKDDNPKATKEELQNRRRGARINIEKQLVENFTGKKSGLSDADVELLAKVNNLFDLETHGSVLSMTVALDKWTKGGVLSLIDLDNETLGTVFMNRFNEVGWMYHRLLTTLQVDEGFGDEWARRWHVLEESFWQMQDGLAKLDKKIGDAFIRFIDLKFPFNPTTRLK